MGMSDDLPGMTDGLPTDPFEMTMGTADELPRENERTPRESDVSSFWVELLANASGPLPVAHLRQRFNTRLRTDDKHFDFDSLWPALKSHEGFLVVFRTVRGGMASTDERLQVLPFANDDPKVISLQVGRLTTALFDAMAKIAPRCGNVYVINSSSPFLDRSHAARTDSRSFGCINSVGVGVPRLEPPPPDPPRPTLAAPNLSTGQVGDDVMEASPADVVEALKDLSTRSKFHRYIPFSAVDRCLRKLALSPADRAMSLKTYLEGLPGLKDCFNVTFDRLQPLPYVRPQSTEPKSPSASAALSDNVSLAAFFSASPFSPVNLKPLEPPPDRPPPVTIPLPLPPGAPPLFPRPPGSVPSPGEVWPHQAAIAPAILAALQAMRPTIRNPYQQVFVGDLRKQLGWPTMPAARFIAACEAHPTFASRYEVGGDMNNKWMRLRYVAPGETHPAPGANGVPATHPPPAVVPPLSPLASTSTPLDARAAEGRPRPVGIAASAALPLPKATLASPAYAPRPLFTPSAPAPSPAVPVPRPPGCVDPPMVLTFDALGRTVYAPLPAGAPIGVPMLQLPRPPIAFRWDDGLSDETGDPGLESASPPPPDPELASLLQSLPLSVAVAVERTRSRVCGAAIAQIIIDSSVSVVRFDHGLRVSLPAGGGVIAALEHLVSKCPVAYAALKSRGVTPLRMHTIGLLLGPNGTSITGITYTVGRATGPAIGPLLTDLLAALVPSPAPWGSVESVVAAARRPPASLLVLGPARGCAARLLRSAARALLPQCRVLLVDSGDAVAGGGDEGEGGLLGGARRVHIPGGSTLAATVENAINHHFPDVIIVAEVAAAADVAACQMAIRRGVAVLAWSPHDDVRSLVMDVGLRDAVGGLAAGTAIGSLARARGPAFGTAVEVVAPGVVRVHSSSRAAVDRLLASTASSSELRWVTEGGGMRSRREVVMLEGEDAADWATWMHRTAKEL